jgi:hypothetical protein
MTNYLTPDGVPYILHETTFINPGTNLETLLFVVVNESGAVVKACASSTEIVQWINQYELRLT